jgi:hypothetical protein
LFLLYTHVRASVDYKRNYKFAGQAGKSFVADAKNRELGRDDASWAGI